MFNMGDFGSSFRGGPLNGLDIMVAEEQEQYEKAKKKLLEKIALGESPDSILDELQDTFSKLTLNHRNNLMRKLISYSFNNLPSKGGRDEE